MRGRGGRRMSGWESRVQSEIQMGNGRLLATFDPIGEVDQFYAPHIDAFRSRVGSFRTSVLVPGPYEQQGEHHLHPELIRIDQGSFNIRLQMNTGTQVLVADYHHKYRPLKIQRRIGLHPTDPVMLDTWKISGENAGLLHESIPWMGHSTSGHCSLYHPTFNGLVHHRDRRWLGVMARGKSQWVRVGHLNEHDRYRLWSGEKVGVPVGPHDLGGYPNGEVSLGWDQVVQGPATWGALAVAPDQDGNEIEFAVICAESEAHLGQLHEAILKVPGPRFFQMTEGMVERRHEPAKPLLEKVRNPRIRALCERSIDVLHALQDGQTGALMAAAEVDPHSRMSGGYGYSWPRDGAYLATALGHWGFRERVEHYFRYCAETQDPSGAWWQRYLASGHAGPSWGRIQIDEPASVIAAAYLHYRTHQDMFWLEGMWPTLQKGLSFLEAFHAPVHPMGHPSHDLWEERMGIHAYSLGAVAAAYLSGAYLAGQLGDAQASERYATLGKNLSSLIHEKFVPAEGPIRRSFVAGSHDFKHGGGYWDEATDVSMLGLISPFNILQVGDRAAQRIVESVRSRLWSRPVGGVIRYEGDTYRGGNPWVLATLWLASVELAAGNFDEAREAFQWVIAKSTPLGMMPEQVHRESGLPYWVTPLGWSHAMFLLFVRQVLDLHAEAKIWENL
jgi:hypothetical protein